MVVTLRGPWAAALAAPLLMLGTACDCGTKPLQMGTECTGVTGGQPGREAACAGDAECADHHACRVVKALGTTTCCVFVDRACATEADCCPGQTCPLERLRCLDRSIACAADADCGGAGDRFCETYTDPYGTSRRCRLHACGPGGACPGGQACFQGECVAGLPCGGSCGPGQACVPTLDRCQAHGGLDGGAAACPVSCAPGFIGAFTDGRNLWDACTLRTLACQCAELPGLPPGELGRDSALALEPGQAAHVSTYDARYGDLVVLSYALDGGLRSTVAVDGVPDAKPTYGPSGLRGGVLEPGPDVGRATDIAAAGGRLYVSYQDVGGQALRVAVRDPAGRWSHHPVDASGDVGRYTSVAVDASGRPAVAYFQRSAGAGFDVASCPAPRPPGPPGRLTALKFARATGPAPASAADWTVRTLACLQAPAPPCEGCAGACANPGGVPGCFPEVGGCVGCTAAQACVSLDGGATCAPRFAPRDLAEVPVGVGVFASLAFRGDEALVAAMRRLPAAVAGGAAKGELVGVTVSAADVPGPLVVLDRSGDTGFFPDLKVDAATGQVGITYHDATSRSLRFYLAPQLQPGVASELVDSGHDGVGSVSSVGADSALVFGPAGTALAVYQDATHGDLKLARRGPGGWVVQGAVSTAGAVGFFADAASGGGQLFTSHARLGRDSGVVLEVLPPW